MNTQTCDAANCKYVCISKGEAVRSNVMPPARRPKGQGKQAAAAALEDEVPAAPAIVWGGHAENSEEEDAPPWGTAEDPWTWKQHHGLT